MPEDRERLVDRLLIEELGQVMKTGMNLSGTKIPFSKTATGFGAKLGAKMSKTDVAEREMRLKTEPKDLLLKLYAWFAKNGRLAEEAEEGSMRVTGVIRAGLMNMSPVVLCVEIGDADEGRCGVHITGFAKEGLISQHAAEKGVAKLAELLGMLKA
jgi:hypothetical protein